MSKWQQPNLSKKQLKKRAKRDARKAARLAVKRNHHFICLHHEGDDLVLVTA